MEKIFGQLTSVPLNETGPVHLCEAQKIMCAHRAEVPYGRVPRPQGPLKGHTVTVWIWNIFTESQCVHTVRMCVLFSRVDPPLKECDPSIESTAWNPQHEHHMYHQRAAGGDIQSRLFFSTSIAVSCAEPDVNAGKQEWSSPILRSVV